MQGLDAGADDYLVKPFSFAEFSPGCAPWCDAATPERPIVLEVGDLGSTRRRARAVAATTEITLSSKEYALFETFMRRPGEALSRYEMLEHAWDYDYENRSNVVDVYVRYLREKVDRPFGVQSIETVRGAGYRLRSDGGRRQATAAAA